VTSAPFFGHVSDAARAALATLDPAKPTVVYCVDGVRSLKALGLLRDAHGFMAWAQP